MKILVVSLLRLGDLIQQEILIAGLREKHPHADIHLLVNGQFTQVEKIFAGKINKFFYFDREGLQRGLGEAQFNILWSFDQLQNLINQINQENYDQILNFTHTKLSAYLIGAFKAKEKKGLYQEEGRFRGLDSPWLRYFNERFSGNSPCLFNYVELLGKSFQIPLKEMAGDEDRKNRREKVILFQCLTSDTKKNWGLDRFLALKSEIETNLADYKVKILGAPFEKETLLKKFKSEDLIICDMQEARAHLKSASLLVTGDTSIKHLAAQLGTPLVEIAIGSSDIRKTGAYSRNAVQLTSQVACAPCTHSAACPQKSHLCAEDVRVDQVFAGVWDQLAREKTQIRLDQSYLDKIVWTHHLDGTQASLVTTVEIVQLIKTHRSPVLNQWQAKTTELEESLLRFRQALPLKKDLEGRTALTAIEVSTIVAVAQDIVRTKKDPSGFFQSALDTLMAKHIDASHFLQQMNTALQEVQSLLDLRNSIISALRTVSQEGQVYAKGIGKLSGVSFEETRKRLPGDLENADL